MVANDHNKTKRFNFPKANYDVTQNTTMKNSILTIMLSKNLTRLYFEVNCTFDQEWVIIKHFFTIARHKLILYMIAAIVQATGTDVATGSFEAVSFRLHLRIISVFHSLC